MRLDEIVRGLEQVLADITARRLPADYAPFALCSLRFVVELIARLEDGRFHDPTWVRTLALDADQRYLAAVRDPAARPGPWRVAFDVADRGKGRHVQNLLLGINAHIFYDLVATLSRYADPAKELEQRADFSRLNDIIRTAVDGVQGDLESDTPWLEAADFSAGRLDEVAVWGAFTLSRARAFDEALRVKAGRTTLAKVERNATALAWTVSLLPF